ncbi:MAG: LytTR family DNA-binding domain-containing protein [Clostridia bacterium]|nr:LytTR family DNA-binding domain-containing protein [Clostridia bacterium]
MLRIGICDDIQDARFSLRCALERALERRKTKAAFFEFSTGERLIRWMENHTGELDLVFLDMEMGDLDGIETAQTLRAADDGLQLVFVTGYSDRVFDGYSVGALGYLMKPPKPEQLDDILTRAAVALFKDTDKTFICRHGDVTYRILTKNILYFVSDRRQVTCVTLRRSYTFYGKLDQVEKAVGTGFVRIHQRYLVRAAAVEHISNNEVHLGDTVLPVSRSCQQNAMLALTRATLEG